MTTEVKEIWESTIPGKVSVEIENAKGRPEQLTTNGKGSRMRIFPTQRELAEEVVRLEQNNPFRNGMLVQVGRSDEAEAEKSSDELADNELAGFFEVTGDEFAEAISSLSEVNIRRLKVLAKERDASVGQVSAIGDLITERFPIGGDTKTYREMNRRPDGAN